MTGRHLSAAVAEQLAREAASHQVLATWLPELARTGERRQPYSEEGRRWTGFAETFCRILQWYKPKDLLNYREVGFPLRPDAVERVADALATVIGHVLDEPDLSDERRQWLGAYDVRPLAAYTAIDDRFATLTGTPITSVLDFGSGIGRQMFLWGHQRHDVRLYSVDAIESLYLLQAEMYQRLFGTRVREYCLDPSPAVVAEAGADAIVHLPTWRLDVVPDRSVDLALCVQVLPEISAEAVRYVLAQLQRIVRPGGLLYIRDKEFWAPTHQLRIGRLLLADGWRLAFRYLGEEGSEIAGTPRLWVNMRDDNSRYFTWRTRLKRALIPSYPRSFRAWRDLGLPI